MDIATIKSDLHHIIDELDDKELLERFHHEVMTLASNSQNIWKSLSQSQRTEIQKALKESTNSKNLLDHDAVIEKYKR